MCQRIGFSHSKTVGLLMSFSQVKLWVPLSNFSPVATFPQRLISKWVFISKNLILFTGSKLGFFGAKVLGTTSSGNTFLKLNKDYSLGKRGFVLELPRDRVIFESVKNMGNGS